MAGMVNREVAGEADGVSEDDAYDAEASGEGNGDYGNFDSLPPIQRLEKYALTQLYQRNIVGRVLLETLKSVADDPHEVASVFKILYNMAENEDHVIRSELMDHVPHIAMLCHSEKEKLLYVVDHLLPLVAKQLMDPGPQVRKAARITLLVLMDQALVGQSAVEEFVCPVVNMLSESDQYPGYRGCAVQLMSKMAPFLGRESTEKFFLSKFCDLCHDPDAYVRKVCAAYFGEFCAVVGQPTTEELLLCRFVDLCHDDEPGVRNACAEVIMSVSCACTLQRRKTILAPMFVSLLCDTFPCVRLSAFKTLGPFISTFAVPSVADLVYNENGELVLVNRDGCEFRLNPITDRAADIDADVEEEDARNRVKRRVRRTGKCNDYFTRSDLSDEGGHADSKPGPLEIFFSQINAKAEKEKDAIENSSGIATEGDGSSPLHTFFEAFDSLKMQEAEKDVNESSRSETTDLDQSTGSHSGDIFLNQSETSSDTPKLDTPVKTDAQSEESDFNSFLYWRVPIPDISLEDLVTPSKVPPDQLREELKKNWQKCDLVQEDFYKSPLKADIAYFKSMDVLMHTPSANKQDIVPQELVELFVSMTNPPHGPPHGHKTDVEIALHCAFSLPAVALTLGRENWGFLRRTYEELAADMQWKVRRTVACSIHELAEILGEELTAKDLVPIYNGLIKDLDEVRIGALKHLADFVKLLPSLERKSFLTQFEMFLITDTEWNWRFREELAQQLLKVIPLYTPDETCTHLVPVAICLLSDKVAAVRSVALQLVTGLINHVTSEGPLLRKLLPQLAQEFANSARWERRQAFALLCSHLVSGRVLGGDQFAREVLPYLLDLSYDRVPNVRLAVARTLSSDIMAHQFFSSEQSPHQEVLMQVLKRLNNDKDRDVRFFADPQRNCTNPTC